MTTTRSAWVGSAWGALVLGIYFVVIYFLHTIPRTCQGAQCQDQSDLNAANLAKGFRVAVVPPVGHASCQSRPDISATATYMASETAADASLFKVHRGFSAAQHFRGVQGAVSS